MADVEARPSIAKCGLARAMVVVFVCVTAAVSLAWSHAKLLSQDEMYEFQTDSVRSLAELVHVQRTWPISLDPLLYHALSHGAMQAFGAFAADGARVRPVGKAMGGDVAAVRFR
jgi:hypothetical protein